MSAVTLPLTITTPLGAGKLLVESASMEEHLSGFFHFDVSMVSADDAVDFDSLVGKDATLTLERASGTKRYFHGMIVRLVQGGRSEGKFHYHADI
ncbi:MAG TPA: contractile injection system protein, VgrG/Pvc8 family, partial [Longimicrobiaceae bacterium]|nr:contractile injection system protein, VgrG/Pvc8 family [Longimicrobiaceae bacterium]